MERLALQAQAQHLQREVESLYGFANIIGTSPAMEQVYALMRKVINSDTTVLITGESGTGKELVARAIHYTSRRRARRFVPVNCGAIPRELLESEMFGHEKGAFSGAHRTKLGLIEEADGGTLFLDEISELPLDLQIKINRVLQEKQVRRVGERTDRPVDVRILSATNRDLQERISQGLFREDLFYRINVYPIPIPPLRAHAEDIPLLINHFIAKYNQTMDKDISGVAPEVAKALQAYSWPGNVRELENAIERAVLLADSGPIKLEHLPPSIWEKSHKPAGEALVNLPYHEAAQAAAHDFSKTYLVAVLKRHQGNVTQAAKDAGIERESFHRLLKKHGLKAEEFRSS
ncbi:MAG: sigma-54 interaction domain-containing protein [Dehalococcoidia bacterium]